MIKFIDNYMIYTSGNEVPKIYHKWTALSVLSALVGRKVWTSQGIMARIFTNTYTVLVGEPASGKSTAMDLGRFLLRDIGGSNFAPAAITLEAMLKIMGAKDSPLSKAFAMPNNSVITYTPMHICANELVTLLGAEPSKMITFLTDIYDREVYDNFTKGKGEDVIRGPYITLCGCMTPSTMDSMCRSKMITGGFSRRIFFIVGGLREGGEPRPIATPAQLQAKEDCILQGRKIQKLAGEFSWTKEGGEFFDNWYNNVKQPQMRSAHDPVMSRWFTAKDVLLLKVTMLLELGKEMPVLELTRDGLEMGLSWLDEIEKTLPDVLGGAGKNLNAGIASRIHQFIYQAGPTGRGEREIFAMFYSEAPTKDLEEMLKHLITIGRIVPKPVMSGKISRNGYVSQEAIADFVAANNAKPPG